MNRLPRAPLLPRLIAHRCAGALAPENTLLGLSRAAAAGFTAVEFDVMLAGDGVPVLIHDETLERTTNGHGRVADTPAARLAELDAGEGEPVPTLAAAAARCLALGLLANVEIKPAHGQEAATGARVAAEVQRYWGPQPVLLSSFSPSALLAARATAPHLPRGLLLETLPEGDAELEQQLAAVGASTLHVAAAAIMARLATAPTALHPAWPAAPNPDLGAGSVATMQQNGRALPAILQRHAIPLLCYTVDEIATAQTLWAAGVTALFTDHLRPGSEV